MLIRLLIKRDGAYFFPHVFFLWFKKLNLPLLHLLIIISVSFIIVVHQQTPMQNQKQEKQLKIESSKYYYFKGINSFDGEALMKMQTNHIMILFFFIGGLHILESEQMLEQNDLRNRLVQYILKLQLKNGGFTCSTLYSQITNPVYQQGHIVFTYSALNCLKILGALHKINKQAVLSSLSQHQKQDGSFSSFKQSTQSDLRFVYSALSVCSMLEDFSTINVNKAKQYIDSCYNFDGGYGLRKNDQSHSGAIYCAIASYQHLGITIPTARKRRTIHFLVNRQVSHEDQTSLIGIQGRVGKSPDSCYSFWVGASLKLLTGKNLLNSQIQKFLDRCYRNDQKSFCKYIESRNGDPVHTFHSITGLKILHDELGDLSVSKLLRQKLKWSEQVSK